MGFFFTVFLRAALLNLKTGWICCWYLLLHQLPYSYPSEKSSISDVLLQIAGQVLSIDTKLVKWQVNCCTE